MKPEHGFSSPSELSEFVSETRRLLKRSGQTDAARVLGQVQATAYTTSSEWLGGLGEAVRRIETNFAVTTEVQARLRRIMAAVHVAWPEM